MLLIPQNLYIYASKSPRISKYAIKQHTKFYKQQDQQIKELSTQISWRNPKISSKLPFMNSIDYQHHTSASPTINVLQQVLSPKINGLQHVLNNSLYESYQQAVQASSSRQLPLYPAHYQPAEFQIVNPGQSEKIDVKTDVTQLSAAQHQPSACQPQYKLQP